MAFTGKLGTVDSRPGNVQPGIAGGGGGSIYEQSVESELTLTQAVVESGVRRDAAATSTLVLTSEASTPRPLHKSASSTLALTSVASVRGPQVVSATSALSLTDSARSGSIIVAAENTLVLFDAGRVIDVYTIAAESTLSLVSSAIAPNLRVFATSTLELTDRAESRVKVRDATSELSLTSTASGEAIRNAISVLTLTDLAVSAAVSKRAESFLELTSTARNQSIKLVGQASELVLTQEATSNIKMRSIEDVLELTDTLYVTGPRYAVAESELTTIESVFDIDTFTMVDVITGLQDSASVIVNTVRPIQHIISFLSTATQSLARADGIDCEAESVLSLTQEGRISIVKTAANTLALTQTASATVSRPVESQLSSLNVAATVVVSRLIAATNEIGLNQAVAFVLEAGDTLCEYTPFVGSTTDPNAPTPPPSTYPAAGGTSGFRLQYPASGGVTDQLILRAPNLGNQERLSMTRINRETRGGTLIVFADPIWPKVETLLLSFSGLSQAEGQALMTFMESYLGQEIRLIDWEDRLWTGVIVNPQDPVVQDGPGCQFTASFEFEGEKV